MVLGLPRPGRSRLHFCAAEPNPTQAPNPLSARAAGAQVFLCATTAGLGSLKFCAREEVVVKKSRTHMLLVGGLALFAAATAEQRSAAAAADVVMYATDAATTRGNWVLTS